MPCTDCYPASRSDDSEVTDHRYIVLKLISDTARDLAADCKVSGVTNLVGEHTNVVEEGEPEHPYRPVGTGYHASLGTPLSGLRIISTPFKAVGMS